jgi:acyl carrier protein
VLELEMAFNICIPDDDALEFKKIADVKKYIDEHAEKNWP